MAKRNKFWMLFAEGQGAPTNKHDNYIDALTEAKRLMTSKNMARCYILEATGVVEAERTLYHEEITYDEISNAGLRDVLRPEDIQPKQDDHGGVHS